MHGCRTLCYVSDSVVSAPYSTALCLQDVERSVLVERAESSVLCPSSKLERLRRLAVQGGLVLVRLATSPVGLLEVELAPKAPAQPPHFSTFL
jgi:hypothetical protein